MENALLYTFSTIAQALGGAFALLAAFVLYRFQSIGPSMMQDSTQIRGNLTSGGAVMAQFDMLRVQAKWPELMIELDSIRERTNPQFSLEELAVIERMKATVRLQASLEKSFRYGAITTALVMFYSVAAIPFAHVVVVHCAIYVSWILLAIGVSGFAACLYVYWKIIKTALYR